MQVLRKGRATMDEEQAMRLVDLRQRIDTGDYRVEPEAVADAIIQRLRQWTAARSAKSDQSECSYPDTGSVASTNTTSGEPATTRPTQLRPDGRMASISLASAGMQTHNS